LVEIRPADLPEDQIQVVAHEASHFLMRRVTPDRLDDLAARAHRAGPAGSLVWRYMWEGIPTALGQGLADARLSPKTFSLSSKWYHIPTIDRFAKLVYPSIAEAVDHGQPLDGDLLERMTHVVKRSSLFSEAAPEDFLMTSFFAAGDHLGPTIEALQNRLMPRLLSASRRLPLQDPALAELLQRYVCLPGVVLVTADELPRAASLGGASLPADILRQVERRMQRGEGAIVAGKRPAGGPVFYLIAPHDDAAGPVLEAFLAMRGFPSGVVAVPLPRRGNS
jgi:hypothetical protein